MVHGIDCYRYAVIYGIPQSNVKKTGETKGVTFFVIGDKATESEIRAKAKETVVQAALMFYGLCISTEQAVIHDIQYIPGRPIVRQ